MADIKVTQVSNYGSGSNEMTFEAKNVEYVDAELIKSLFRKSTAKIVKDEGSEKALFNVPSVDMEVKHDVVAIYDDAGIPSIMHRFRKISNKELFRGSDRTNAAFIIGGEEYDEIFISVYENCEINGKPYSLPMQKPWTNITNDEAAKACFSKGEGWHLMTRAEWGLLANLSRRNGTLPHGNTNYGKYHADEKETGELAGHYGMTKTGSEPVYMDTRPHAGRST